MYCNCGCADEMARKQHELKIYMRCPACGRVHWTDKMAKSAAVARAALAAMRNKL